MTKTSAISETATDPEGRIGGSGQTDRPTKVQKAVRVLEEQVRLAEANPAVQRYVDRTKGDGRLGSWKREVNSTRDLMHVVRRAAELQKPSVRREQNWRSRSKVMLELGFVRMESGFWMSDGVGAIKRSPQGRWWALPADSDALEGPFKTARAAATVLVQLKGNL